MSQINGVQKTYRPEKGSILLEALLATVILSLSMTLIIQSMLSAAKSAKYASEYAQSFVALQNSMSGLLKNGFISEVEEKKESISFNNKEYFLDVKTKNVADEKNLVELDAKLSWESKTKNNNLTLVTYAFNENEDEKP